MAELILGGLVGLLLSAGQGWPVEAQWVAAVLAGSALYLGSCAWWPHTECPRCGGRSTKRSQPGGTGHYRRAGRCSTCGGGDYVRLGARLLGRG